MKASTVKKQKHQQKAKKKERKKNYSLKSLIAFKRIVFDFHVEKE